MESVTYLLENDGICHEGRTVTTWGNPERLIAIPNASTPNFEKFFKLHGDSDSPYRYVIKVQQDCIVNMNWHQGVKSLTDQDVIIILRNHRIALKKSLRANELEILSLSKVLNFNIDIISPPYDFTFEIHHEDPILFDGKGHMDLTVIWSES